MIKKAFIGLMLASSAVATRRARRPAPAARVGAAALTIARTRDLDACLSAICEATRTLTDADWATVRVGDRADDMTIRSLSGALPAGLLGGTPVALVNEFGRSSGLLHIGPTRHGPVSPEDLDLVMMLAPLAATTIERTRGDRQRHLATSRAAIDPLTGLASAHGFHERLADEAERAGRHERRLSLVLMDIDHLGHLNDAYGRTVGDRVLVEIGRRVARLARVGDLVARAGPEGFAWLLPDARATDALRLAEQVRRSLEQDAVVTTGVATLSAGVAEILPGNEATDLYLAADAALSWAKSQGRNRSSLYEANVMPVLAHGAPPEEGATRASTSLRTLAVLVDAKDSLTRGRSERVATVASAIAATMGWRPAQVDRLREAALIHDVGLLAVPGSVLRKTTPLTPSERERIRQHPRLGSEIAASALDGEQVSWVRAHHEQPDGHGYPEGISDDGVPVGAGILGVASAWAAMTSPRRERPAHTAQAAIGELRAGRGTRFQATPVDALADLIDRGAVA